ncbi:MAG: flagellar motor switch protein FliN [SAR324 cluster bacterium]|nr:flagellar motor switch protein FliN [SAR324 cluster bacterium]
MAIEEDNTNNSKEQEESLTEEYRELYSDRIGAIKNAQTTFDSIGVVTDEVPYHRIEFLHDINLKLSVEFGRSRMTLGEVLNLRKKSVVLVDKTLGEPVDILAGDALIARGEVVIVNERLGIRITEIVRPAEKTRVTTGASGAAEIDEDSEQSPAPANNQPTPDNKAQPTPVKDDFEK